jgi:hypothetical protein
VVVAAAGADPVRGVAVTAPATGHVIGHATALGRGTARSPAPDPEDAAGGATALINCVGEKRRKGVDECLSRYMIPRILFS